MRLFRNPVSEVLGFYFLLALVGLTIVVSVALPVAATFFFITNIA